MAKIYAVVNRKGGVGKTTTAINVAHGLARMLMDDNGEPTGSVLLIDLDPQGNCSTALGITSKAKTVGHLLLNEATLDECIVSADREAESGLNRPNLFVLPSSSQLAETKLALIAQEAVNEVVNRISRSNKKTTSIDSLLTDRLSDAVEVFDYIIIDCPPSLDALNNAVYHFADAAIVPVKVDYLGAVGAVQHTKDILDAQSEGIEIRVGLVVPTFVKKRQVLAREVLQTLNETYGEGRVSTPIPTSVKLEESPASAGGSTIFEYAPNSAPATAYQDLVERVYHGKI